MHVLWFKGPSGEPFQFDCGARGIHIPTLAKKLQLQLKPLKLNGVVIDFDVEGYKSITDAGYLQSAGDSAATAILVSGQPAGQAGFLTEKSYIAQPLHKMLQRLPQQDSSSRTNPRNPRTFETLVEWTDFLPGARQRFSQLDDINRRFPAKVVANEIKLDDGTLLYGQEAYCERDVKSYLNQHVLQCVTQVAKARAKDVEFTSAGAGRQLSNTDLLIRKCGVTKRKALSKLILGVVEVKGNWQLKLGREDDLIAALHDPRKVDEVVDVVQQAFAAAVIDEAPLIIISNYEVTYFLLRGTQDAAKRILKTSPPVPWDSQDPPAMACFLHALEVSAELWADTVKAKLTRDDVLCTPVAGYSLQSGGFTLVPNKAFQHGVAIQGPRHSSAPRQSRLLPQREHCPPQQQQQGSEHYQQQQGLEHHQRLAAAQQSLEQQQQQQQQQDVAHQQQEQLALEEQQREQQQLAQLCAMSNCIPAGSTVPESVAALAQHAQQVDLMTRGSSSDGGSPTSSAHCLAVRSSSISDSSSVWGHDWQAWVEMAQDSGLSSAITAVEALPYLLPPQLRYTDEGISSSSTSTVVKGYLHSEEIALKIYNKTADAMRMFLAEAASYIMLADLQGESIMPLAALGRLPHSGACVLGLSLGQPVPRPLSAGLAESAKAALDKLHKAGYSHGDISIGNMLVFGDRVLLCDLQTCQAVIKHHSLFQEYSLFQDVAELQELLAGDDATDEALVRH